jgi:hypothetical protein
MHSPVRYPEFDAVGIWRSIIEDHQTDFTRALPAGRLQQIPLLLAEMAPGHLAPAARPVPVRPCG